MDSALWSCIPWKVMIPSPGVWITSLNTLKPSASVILRACSLSSIRRLLDSLSVFWTSRMQTERKPRFAMLSSINSSPKKWDLPDPRPPYAPLYLAGASSGTNTRAVSISSSTRVHDGSLDRLKAKRVLLVSRDGHSRQISHALTKQDLNCLHARG